MRFFTLLFFELFLFLKNGLFILST